MSDDQLPVERAPRWDATGNHADSVRAAAESIWLAGLGAFAAQGGDGARRFAELVAAGRAFARTAGTGSHPADLPTRDDLERLQGRIEQLARAVDAYAASACMPARQSPTEAASLPGPSEPDTSPG